MTTFTSVSTMPIATSASGNSFAIDSKATITANLTTSDEVVLMSVPAGCRLHELLYRNGDLDTGTTLAFNLGYRSTHPNQAVTAAPTYFLSASTAGQAAQASWVSLTFDALTFQEPVQIVLKPTVSATGLSGTPVISALAKGIVVGVN